MTSALILATLIFSPQAPSFPTHGFKEGQVYKYTMKGGVSIQPYTTGGTVSVKVQKKSEKLLMANIDHDVVMEASGQKEAAGLMQSVWEMTPSFLPTGTGEGALPMGEQLMACLLLPTKATDFCIYFGGRTPTTSKVEKVKETLKVTTVYEAAVGQITVEQILDEKTSVLQSAKLDSTGVLGKTTYELKLQK